MLIWETTSYKLSFTWIQHPIPTSSSFNLTSRLLGLKNMYNYRQFHEKLKRGNDRIGRLSQSAIDPEYGGHFNNCTQERR